MLTVWKNYVTEFVVESGKSYRNPFLEVSFYAEITSKDDPSFQMTLPAFLMKKDQWGFRFSAAVPGFYRVKIQCSDEENSFSPREYEIEVTEPDKELLENEKNPGYVHGRLQVSERGNCFVHADGTPFFVMADYWGHTLAKRVTPNLFNALVEDRAKKGFNTAIITLGQFPDIMPFDSRAETDGGYPWDPDFTTIRPEYYKVMDQKIQKILSEGLIPMIVGTWGHLAQSASIEFMKKHWENLIARYAAYPVIFSGASEAPMMLHGDYRYTPEENRPWREIMLIPEKRAGYGDIAREAWIEVMKYLRHADPYCNVLSIQAGPNGYPYPNNTLTMIPDNSLVDYEIVSDYDLYLQGERKGRKMPVIAFLPALGMTLSGNKIMKDFWHLVINGAAGAIYTECGVYFGNTRKEIFGRSGHCVTWCFEVMEHSMHDISSEAFGRAARLLQTFDWSTLSPHREWVISPREENGFCNIPQVTDIPLIEAAGNEDGAKLFYVPLYQSSGHFITKPRLFVGEQISNVRAYEANSMTEFSYGVTCPDKKGQWILHKNHYMFQVVFGDLVVLVDPNSPVDASEKRYFPEDAMEVPEEDDPFIREHFGALSSPA